jgi:hypothetical protein
MSGGSPPHSDSGNLPDEVPDTGVPAGHVEPAEIRAQRRREQLAGKAAKLLKFALVESAHHGKRATLWRTVDVLLVLASGILAGFGGVSDPRAA